MSIGGAPSLLLRVQETTIGQGNLYECTEGYRTIGTDKYFSETTSTTNEYRPWNWSLKGSAGLRWEMADEYVLVEVSADHGLTPIQRETLNGRNTTGLYALSVGYGFRL